MQAARVGSAALEQLCKQVHCCRRRQHWCLPLAILLHIPGIRDRGTGVDALDETGVNLRCQLLGVESEPSSFAHRCVEHIDRHLCTCGETDRIRAHERLIDGRCERAAAVGRASDVSIGCGHVLTAPLAILGLIPFSRLLVNEACCRCTVLFAIVTFELCRVDRHVDDPEQVRRSMLLGSAAKWQAQPGPRSFGCILFAVSHVFSTSWQFLYGCALLC
mmetsp:Transcript_22734/g.37615  ORF Transcript_22734/g.37615 Transcript_22734/m.37615 type:complete len:218 (-) Transcript_22734:675-1328(-)